MQREVPVNRATIHYLQSEETQPYLLIKETGSLW